MRASEKGSSDQQIHTQKQKRRRNRRTIGFMPLEPRIMYDGAAAASAASAHHHADHHDVSAPQASGSIGAPPSAPAAPPATNGDWHAHWSGEQGKTGNIAYDRAAPGYGMAPVVPSIASQPVTQVVFVDSQVPDVQDLLNGAKPGVKVFEIDSGSDGLAQIANILAENDFTNLTAIDIVGHGEAGQFIVGATNLTDGSIASEATYLSAIGKSLVPGGDLMLYGCDVAQGAAGQQFIDDLSTATGGANVAASTQEIGTVSGTNGTFENWTLDASTGPIDATTPFTQSAMDSYEGLLAGTTVTVSAISTTLTTDADGDKGISPGDTVTSSITINNTTSNPATGLTLSETLSGLTETGNVVITPLAINDTYTMTGNTPETFDAAHGVLANDIDFNGDTLTVDTAKGASNVTGGSVTLNSDGSFTFTPTTGFSGTASFDYFVKDAAAGDSDQAATATITVTAPVWYVDSAASSSGADGSFAHPFLTIDAAVNAAGADTSAGVNNIIFVENAGSAYIETSAITLKSGEELLGDGSSLTSVNGNTVGLSGNNPTFSVSSTSADVTLNTNNIISGINITNTGTGAGIIDDGGTIGTLTMSNIAVTTSSGTGIELDHGGTVDVTGTSNTISSSTGTALDVEGTTIGSEGVTFKSISSGTGGSAANAGIILENTGSSGGLTVTGDGNASLGGDGSGGTIENKTGGVNISGTDGVSESTSSTTGTGIFLKNTIDPSFTNMTLENFSNFGIYGFGVAGFTLSNSTVTTTSGFNGQSDAGGSEEGSIRFDNLFGVATITGSQIGNGYADTINIQDGENSVTTGTLDLTISGNQLGFVDLNDSILLTAWNNTVFDATVTSNTFIGTAADFFSIAGQDTSTTNVIVSNNTFDFGETPISGGSDPISVSGDKGTWDITSNIIDSSTAGTTTGTGSQNSYQEQAIFVDATDGTGTVNATVEGNLIGPAFGGNAGQQSNAAGIAAQVVFGETLDLLLENNTLTGYSANQGISLLATEGTNTLNATVFGNTESSPNTAFGTNEFGIAVTGAATGGQVSTINLVLGSATVSSEQNTFVGHSGIGIATSNLSGSDIINLSEDGGGSASVASVLNNDNVGSPGWTSGGVKNPTLVNNSGPTLPPVVPTLLTAGFAVGGSDTEGLTIGVTFVSGFQYQWQESFSGSEYVDIFGATSNNLTLTESDVGATLRLVETQTNSDGTADTAISAATSSVADNLTLTASSISGTETVGQILTASAAVPDNPDATVTYQWKENLGSGFVTITGADSQSYRLASTDVGATIEVVATATDPHGGSTSQTTVDVGTVAAFTAPTSVASLSLGTLPGTGSVTSHSNTVDAITVSWEATVNAQSNGLIVNPTYTGNVTGSNFATVTADATVGLDTLSLEGEVFNDANANGLLDGGDSAISGVSVSVFVEGGSTALETTSTNGSGIYDFTGLAAGNYFVEVTPPAGFGNSSPVRDTTPNDYAGSKNYGLAISGGVVSTNAITIAYDSPHPTGATTYPGDDTTNTLDVGLTKNPVITNTGNTVDFYQGNSSVAVDSGLTLADSVNVNSATVTISSGFLSGDTLNFTTQNGISGVYSGGTLTLSGSATAAQYQTALESITYSFSGDPTNAGADKTRSVSWSVSDTNSQTSAAVSTSTIDAFVVPALATGAGFTTPVMTTSGALAADSDLTVADVNTTGSAPVATVTISSGFDTGDTLSYNGGTAHTFGDGGKITGTFVAGTHTLTLTGTAGTSAADFQAAFEAVQFNTTNSNSNDGTRTLTWQFNDDAGNNANNSNALTTNFNVEFPPTLSNTGNTAEFYQNQASGTLVDSAITIADPNVAVTSATATISSGFLSGDTLSFNNGSTTEIFGDGSVITAAQSGNTLTLTTTTGTSTAADYQTALESVKYSFTGDPTNAGADHTRTLSWSVTDANNQTSAAGSTTTLDVFALPIVSAGAAGTPTETSTSGPVIADSTLSITDYNGTTIHNASVQITSGDVASDTLTINGTTSGTINDGASGTITYSFSGATLTLTGTDTVADYITTLDKVKLDAVSPNSGTRTLTWEVNDQAGSNVNNSAPLTTNVDVVFGPQVTAGATVTFNGGGGPVALDGTLTVSDAANPTITSAAVAISSGFTTGDTLTINGTTSGTIDNGANGTITYSFSGSTLSLTGSDTVADYQNALDLVNYSFSPTNADPTAGGGDTSRTISWTVTDAASQSDTPAATSTLDVVHTAPTVTAGAAVTYETEGPAATADGTLTVTDPDSAGNLSSATVTISAGFASGDTLNFTNQNNITGSYDAVHGILTLTGTDTVADYQTALDSITFSSTNTTAGSRTLSWVANDGSTSNGSNAAATSTVDVEIGPHVTAGATATFNGGGSPVTLDGTLTVTDGANANLDSATVSISSGFLSGDTLNFTNQAGISGSYDAVHGTLTLTGSSSVANYQTALDSITYSFSPTNGDPTGGGGDTSRTVSWSVSDGVVTTAAAASTLDTVHVAPVVTAGAIVTFDGGSSPVTLDGALTVTDPDSGGNLSGATVSVSAGFLSGDSLNFTNQNGITGTYDAVHGILTLTGTDTVADYQTALDSITYSFSPTNGDPTGGGGDTSRTVSWTGNDGTATSTAVTSTVDTVHVAPTVTAGGTATFTGGGSAVTLDGTLTLTDVDSAGNLTGATVKISSGLLSGDTLNFANQNGITGSYDAATGLLTLTGTASVANYQTALDSITYSFSPSNGDPTGGGGDTSRTITWTANDGSTSNGTGSSTSTLDTVHVAPAVTSGGTVTFTGGGSPVDLDSTLTVSDVDSSGNLTGATVSVSSGFLSGDTLNFTNQNGISGSYDAVHGVLTLTGTSTIADYQTALDSVTYSFSPSNGDPTGGGSDTSRTISWVANDGNTISGISNTGTSTLDTVHVAPTVTAGGTVTFTGGGGPVTLDSGLTVSDVDSSGQLSGATVSVSSGFLSGDTLDFTNQAGISGSYDATHGILTLTGTATIAQYQTALESISYSFSPSNGDPTNGETDTSRTISWTVTDGSTSNGTSNTGTSTLDTTHTPPTVIAGASATFDGGGSPVTLDGTLTVTDPDSFGNLSSAFVTINSGFVSGDTLNFTNQNGITGSYNAVNGQLTLTGTASVADYQTALDSVTYSFTPANGDPTNGGGATSRTIAWTADDGESSATGGSTLTVVHVAPTVTAGGTATFDGGGSPVTLDGTLTATDVDSNGNLAGATVSISSGFLSGDTLNFTNQAGISGSYDAVHGIMTLSGTSSLVNYQTALESITYSFSPTNGDPTAGGGDTSRTINWTVNDGSTSNGVATASSTLDTVHVAPVVSAGATTQFELTGPAVTADGALTVTDPDSAGDLTGARVLISSGLDATNDVLNFTNQNGITGSYDPLHGILLLTGTATVADYQAALESITFSSTTASTGTRTLSWNVFDGSTSNGISNIGTSTIDLVVGPQLTAGATATFDGGGSPVTLDGALTVSDTAQADLTGATVSISANFLSGDELNFTNQNGITGSYDAVHGTLTLTGTSSVANYQTALDSITYSFSPTNGDPTNGGGDTTRTISWSASDSVASSTAVTSSLDTVHVAPTVTAGGTATFDGGGAPVALDGTATVSDVDSAGNLTGATVSISANFLSGDVLNFTNQNGITGSYDAVHGTLTLTGTSSVANYQTALDSITYSFSPSNGDPTGGGGDTSRTISYTVTDGSTSNGTSNTATSTLDTEHVAPTVTAGGTATFDGGGSAVTLDSALSLSDPDSSGQLSGATVSISSNFLSGDELNFTNQAGITGSYDAVHGVLTLTGTSSIASYQTALESISYSFNPLNGDPTGGGGDTARTISWSVTDGNTSNGISKTSISTLDTVHVAPTVTAGGTATFDGGGSPVTLDGTVSVSDVDSSGQLSGATVSISSNFLSGDVLNFTNQAGISGSYDAVHGILTLTGTSSIASYQTALDSITYSFSPANGDPTHGGGDTSRTVSWTVTDGNTSNGTSTTKTSTLDVVHEPPTVTAGATVTLSENNTASQAAIVLDSTLTLADPDSNGVLTGATVSISSGFLNNSLNSDVLNFTNQNGITGHYDAVHGILTLSGPSSIANYQTALESITFNSIGPNPSNDGANPTRTISYTVTDGSTSNGSATATSTVNVQAYPIVVAGGTVDFHAGLFSLPVQVDPNIGVYDGTNLTSATVSIANGFVPGDLLLASTGGTSIHESYNPATGLLTLTGNDTVAHYDKVLQSVSFFGIQTNNGTADISTQVTDTNGKTSLAGTSHVKITGLFGPPITPPPPFNPLPYQPPHSGSGDFFGVSLNFPGEGPALFGDGQGVIPLHADINVTVADNGAIDFNVPLGMLEASLDGDVVSITATLPDGKPLPDWLQFNPSTGKFAGLVPGDVLTGSIAPGGGNTGGGNQGGLVPDTLTVEVIARDAKGDIAIIDFTINLKPDKGTHHGWNLPRDFRNIAPAIELPHNHALLAPHHGLAAPHHAATHGHDLGLGHGRAGLSQQLAAHGLHGMHADRMALLESLRHATAGHS